MKKNDRITEFKVSLQIPIKESDDNFTEFESVDIPTSDDYSIIKEFYNWFVDESRVDFNNMCWNAPF